MTALPDVATGPAARCPPVCQGTEFPLRRNGGIIPYRAVGRKRTVAGKAKRSVCGAQMERLEERCQGGWWRRPDSDRRHPACKAGALPTELRPRTRGLVGLTGIEPVTSSLSGTRSNQLSYKPGFARKGRGTLASENPVRFNIPPKGFSLERR